MTMPIHRPDNKFLPEHLCAGLTLLKRAHDYALDLGTTVWDFAVEIQALQQAGLDHNDLRWLARRRYIEWGCETVNPTEGRRFLHDDLLDFTRQTCFVLTSLGTDMCQYVFPSPSGANGSNMGVDGQCHGEMLPSNGSPTCPKWDSDRHELRVGRYLVKQYKLNSPNQESILTAFEEEGWPPRIHDPLIPQPEAAPKERLRNTIKSLNRKQVHRLIRFMGDGTGEAVRWELMNDSRLACVSPSSLGHQIG